MNPIFMQMIMKKTSIMMEIISLLIKSPVKTKDKIDIPKDRSKMGLIEVNIIKTDLHISEKIMILLEKVINHEVDMIKTELHIRKEIMNHPVIGIRKAGIMIGQSIQRETLISPNLITNVDHMTIPDLIRVEILTSKKMRNN